MSITVILIIFLYFLLIMVNDCASSSLLQMLRKHKAISFQSRISSPIEMNIEEGSKLHLTCSFLSNFPKIDLYWFHNGTLIQSFISKTILDEEDDDVENPFLAVTIVSTINIEKSHFDMNGLYQCIGVHNEIRTQKTFNIHIVANEANSIKTNFSEDAFITVHTYQALFEPRKSMPLMCRFGGNQKDACTTQWFDPQDESLTTISKNNDLILTNANFEDNMGLYNCQICCHNQCQSLTSFVYPAGQDD